MRTDFGDLITEVQDADRARDALGTAEWMGPREASRNLAFRSGPSDQIWLGEIDDHPLGYEDDRHVALISGTRGGKGAGVIVPNLCLWPGSCIVIDPKGENATVTAQRRGAGSEYSNGMGQKVCILDPFGEVPLDASLKARFNPLDVIDRESELAVDDAGRIAAAIIVRESKNDPFWEDAARNLVRGLILHVLSADAYQGARNLLSVRRLLTHGDWLNIERLRQLGESEPASPFLMLWERMRDNHAYDGVASGVAEQMLSMAEKTRSSVLETARTNTAFIEGGPMQRLLEISDFDLAGLKTDPNGLSIYLTLPQRYMETHFRWLRLMVSLAVGEMERIKGRPRAGHPTLFLLDEFAGLKRMEVIENAVAQAAGFGVKFFFVVQNLAQLKKEYEDGWETFVSNSGAKIFFQIDDHFTRDYLSRLIGEREVRRETRSGSQAVSKSESTTDGTSTTTTTGTARGQSTGESASRTYKTFWLESKQLGANKGTSVTESTGTSEGTSHSLSESLSDSRTYGWGEAVHKRPLLTPDEIGRFLARIDDRDNPAYPGIVLAVLPGKQPLLASRINYFEASRFAGLFDPHPNYKPPPTLLERARAEARAAAKAAALAAIPTPTPKRHWKDGRSYRVIAGGKSWLRALLEFFLELGEWAASAFTPAVASTAKLNRGASAIATKKHSSPYTAPLLVIAGSIACVAYMASQNLERQRIAARVAAEKAIADANVEAAAAQPPADTITGTIDTFTADAWPQIAGRSVPLFGIDAITPAGDAVLSRWLDQHTGAVSCFPIHGAAFRCVTADGYDLAQKLLFNGLARLSPEVSNGVSDSTSSEFTSNALQDYRQAQNNAQVKKIGVWASN